MDNKKVIFQQNLNKSADPELAEFVGEKAAGALMVFLSEYVPATHDGTIGRMLEQGGFALHYPLGYPKTKTGQERHWPICVLAVRKNIPVQWKERAGLLEYRYFEGTADVNGAHLDFFFQHVPQTCISDDTLKKVVFCAKKGDLKAVKKAIENQQDRMCYKAEHLFAAYCFSEEHPTRALVGGDLNTDDEKPTSLQSILRRLRGRMLDTTNHEPTWKNKCLDYALVTRDFAGAHTDVLDSPSDHSCLITTLPL